MNTLFLYNLLISTPFQGLIWILFLFFASFAGVYVANLAHLGWEHKVTSKKTSVEKAASSSQEKKAPAEKPQEPIYYIVEKKKRRPKQGYGDPQPFQFKEG